MIFAYFVIQILSGIYTGKLTENLSGPIEGYKAQYRDQIAETTDAYTALRLGQNFTKAQDNELALIAFTRATEIDNQYRDGWVLRGYSELKNNKPAEALISLKKAEEIDPVNAQTYELLAIAYTENEDTDAAKKAQEKYKYLTEHSQ